jgi:hypothetical protein
MHLIDSLEFDVALASEERAFEEQERLQGFLRGSALQVIRSVFDELSPPQEVWRLDRLEVDLGVVSGSDLDAQWERRLREQLQVQLLRLMQGRHASTDAVPQPLGGPGLRHGPALLPLRQTDAPDDLPALVHYLRRGTLPWHVVLPAGQRLADWAGSVLQLAAPALAHELRAAADRQRMVRRLAQQLPPATLAPLAHALGLPAAWPLADWVDDAARSARSSAPAGSMEFWRRRLWELVLQQALGAAPGAPPQRQLQDALRAAGHGRGAVEPSVDPAPDATASDLVALLHFLRRGRWPHQTSAPARPQRAAWATTLLAGAMPTLTQHLRDAAHRKRMTRRLVQLLPSASLEQLAHALGWPATWSLAAWVDVAARSAELPQGPAAPQPERPAPPHDGASLPERPSRRDIDAAGFGKAVADTQGSADVAAQVEALRQRFWECLLMQAPPMEREAADESRWQTTLAWAARSARTGPADDGRPPISGPNDAATTEEPAATAPDPRAPADRLRSQMEALYALGDPARLETAVRGHLRQDAEGLHAWLVDAGRLRRMRRWLATSLSAPTWHRLLTLIAPAAAAVLQQLLQRRRFGGGWTRLSHQRWSRTSCSLREAVLTVLLAKPQASSDPVSLVAATVAQAAQRFHTTAAHAAAMLHASLEQAAARPGRRSAEFDVLGGWLREQAASDGAIAVVAAAARGPAPPAAARETRPPTEPPPQPALALARALRQRDATLAWLAWQACEATDPAGAGAQLAALCRQPMLCEALARCLPASRQLALVARVAPAAQPVLDAWFGRRGGRSRRMAPSDAAAHDRGAIWSAWWAAWAKDGDERAAVADLRSRWRFLDEAPPRAGARLFPVGDPNLPPPRARRRLDAGIRILPSGAASAAAQGSVLERLAAAEAGISPSSPGAAPPTPPHALPALLRQWQAAASSAPMTPALRRAWHRACGTAGARAWLVASLPPARLLTLAAQLAPGEAAVLRAWTQAPWWPSWRGPAAPGTAAWTLSGWWRLWFARWAAGPPIGAFDRAGALDAWLVHAARASGQRLPDYLAGLAQRLQTTQPSADGLQAPGSAADHVTVPTGTSGVAVTAHAEADPADFALQRVRALSLAERDSGHAAASRRVARDRRRAQTPPAVGASRPAASTWAETLLTPAPPTDTQARPRAVPQPAADARLQPASPATRWRPPPAPGPEPGEAVSVDNAGLVLLAGFAPRLFTMLGLLAGRAFADEDAAARAVHLLQWLVDERPDADEHELVLNKLLCGLHAATPVPRDVVLQPHERDAAQQMLQGVIAHWSALGRTSVQGLRESFLQREGRLSRDETAWRLRVAPRAFDMLLDRLPWSYTMLKLPWMPEVLHVEWR